jgi:hypothetical protein
VAMLPLAIGMLMLLTAPERTNHALGTARNWLGHNLRMVAGSLAILLAASLFRGGSQVSRTRRDHQRSGVSGHGFCGWRGRPGRRSKAGAVSGA